MHVLPIRIGHGNHDRIKPGPELHGHAITAALPAAIGLSENQEPTGAIAEHQHQLEDTVPALREEWKAAGVSNAPR